MMKYRFFVAAVLFILFSAVAVQAEQGQANIRLRLAEESTAEQMVIELVVSDVTDLYGAEVRLRYDPLIIKAVDSDPNQEALQVAGGSLLPVEKGFVVKNTVDEEQGVITYAVTLINPATPVTGEGVLLKATFQVLRPNFSTIDVEHAKLVAYSLDSIPTQTEPFSFGTAHALTEAVARTELAKQDNAWWSIVGIVMVIFGIGLISMVIVIKARRRA